MDDVSQEDPTAVYPPSVDAVQPGFLDGDRPIVGRRRELTTAFQTLEIARRGTAAIVCLEGGPGTGKSTLLQAMIGRATELGFATLTARASAAERGFPFGVVRQLFEHAPIEHSPAGWNDHDDEVAVLHSLHRQVADLAPRGPMLLAVDDVDQADPPSLRWLAFLRRRMSRLPAVLAITTGVGGSATDRTLLIEVVTGARRLALGALDADGCAALVRAAMAPYPVAEEFADACREVTDGNPFMLGELLHVLRVEGVRPDGRAVDQVRRCRPPWLASRLLATLRAQDPALATLTRAVAVLGTPDLEVAAAAAGMPLPMAADATASLARMGVLKPGQPLEFRSSITQSAVAQDVSPLERDAIHARAAVLLRDLHAAQERIAAHLMETMSIEGEWVARTLCSAGRQAIVDGSHDLALACLRRALREPLPDEARDEVLVALGMVEVLGHPADAIEHLGAVRGADRAWAQRFRTMARAYAATISGESAHRAAELASGAWRERSRTEGDNELRTVSELCYTVLPLVYADRLDAAMQCCTEVLAGTDEPLVTEIANALTAKINYRAGDVGTAMATARSSLYTRTRLGMIGWIAAAIALPVLIDAAIDRDELDVAREAIEQSNFSRELPEFWRYLYVLCGRGRLHAAVGELHAALADQLECGRRFQESGIVNPAVVSWRSHAASLYSRLGQQDQAVELAAQDLTLARRWGAPRALGVALRTAGMISQGDRGRVLLAEAVAVLQQSGAKLELARALAELGVVLGRAGRHDESVANLRRARELSEHCGATGLLAKIDGRLCASPASRPAVARHDLTPHELRIASMVMSGRTNRDIAAELRVTSRAVELHLTRLYRKLGIARRSQLATALHGWPKS